MSPFTLLQEELQRDPWKIFICCIFCNLTKRIHAEQYFWEVIRKWPTPVLLAAADAKELELLIKPLGLSQRRAKALIVMSYEYTHKDWHCDPSVLYGIGKYGSDAYHIFCTDKWRDIKPTDSALKNYLGWLNKNEVVQ